ncbi:hypothetical protein ORJ04_22570 [Rheinheimera baltica]|uniref:DUF3667 domain-containing protein n=1 Tax=Rheinheimera baltica TaxID=67576 RepID=A0ABT9I5T3_9GAMM|nr:hypothetical protein [Rheinheimera baltica]MDP5138734.1 hypothetical protein [Rheinheimera baltica]
MHSSFSCPSCQHKVMEQPLTGKCPECSNFNYAWNIVDKKRFDQLLKIKIFGSLAIATIFLVSALVLFGQDHFPNGHNSKSGIFNIIFSVLHALLSPYLGLYAVSAAYLSIAVVFFLLAHKYYKNLRAGRYDSHSQF